MAHGAPDYQTSTIAGGASTVIVPQSDFLNSDASQRVLGDVIVWDVAGGDKAAKSTNLQQNPRVCGVVSDATVAAGAFGDFQYHGPALINVIGSGNRGDALITSTTPGAAISNGRIKNQVGFIGYARQAWAGPGLIIAFLDVSEDWYGAQNNIVSNLKVGALASGNLQCGTDPGRYVLALLFYFNPSNGITGMTAPLINGVAMSQVGTSVDAWHITGSSSRFAVFDYYNPGTGLIPVTGGQVNSIGSGTSTTIFISFSGCASASTRGTLNSIINTASTAAITTSDAIPGDIIIGIAAISSNAGIALSFIGSTSPGQTRISLTLDGAILVICVETKSATSVTTTMNFTFDASHKNICASIPVHPG
jgi:hypothetical protein